jgi:hypothetical protein
LVKAEYKYFKSASKATLALSDLEIESLEPSPKEDQRPLMPDMTLRTLETEWIDAPSPLDRWGLFKKDT